MNPGLRRQLHRASVAWWSCCALFLSSPHAAHAQEAPAVMDRIACEFVGLVLELGEHDSGYVDAYYGPPQWQEQARARKRELASIAVDAERLAAETARVRPGDVWEARRVRFLGLQLEALQALDAAMPGTGSLASAPRPSASG